jgi:hypothetical protein
MRDGGGAVESYTTMTEEWPHRTFYAVKPYFYFSFQVEGVEKMSLCLNFL